MDSQQGEAGAPEEGACKSEATVLGNNYPRPSPKLLVVIYSGNHTLERILRLYQNLKKQLAFSQSLN